MNILKIKKLEKVTVFDNVKKVKINSLEQKIGYYKHKTFIME